MLTQLLPGTEVRARSLRWEVVLSQQLGEQTLYRLRGLDGALRGRELDLLHPFEPIEPVAREFQPDRAAPLPNWLVYHEAFLLEQALGPGALLAVQPGRLKIEPHQGPRRRRHVKAPKAVLVAGPSSWAGPGHAAA